MARMNHRAVLVAILFVAAALQLATGAQTDSRFNFYTRQCGNKNVMVCRSCSARNVGNANPNGQKDGDFQIWCLDSGVITRDGDGGLDNWQFKGCFTRSGTQGRVVTFRKC